MSNGWPPGSGQAPPQGGQQGYGQQYPQQQPGWGQQGQPQQQGWPQQGQPQQGGWPPQGQPQQGGWPPPGQPQPQQGWPQPQAPQQQGWPQQGQPQQQQGWGQQQPQSPGEDYDAASEAVDEKAQVPPAYFQDYTGPLRLDQGEDFYMHMMDFDQSAHDPVERRKKLAEYGYRDWVDWHYVKMTFIKHYGRGDPNGPLAHWTIEGPNSTQLMMNASMRLHQKQAQATANANPELLAPVEGVTVEQYAQICAGIGRCNGTEESARFLAGFGLDMAKWERANKGWTAKMSTDTTGTIGLAFSKAFTTNSPAAAGGPQAGAAMPGMSGAVGQAPSGAEPCSFEQYCEMSGAMAAWSESGKDVNAGLKEKWGILAADFSTISMYWGQRAMTDFSLINKQSGLIDQYKARYAEPDPDADLVW